ncbi:hypothetical protein [Flavobacterium kingsejongi]|uniref:Phage tail collar domain-containing protein n=1 Tax=Flavobacterium kingsejongi TaxID=1678728 RepID=A0A2S1LM60_9FLAO|nr:hypothetical protein [Flavobacterium kingsejongi]AWG24832.1 hypothetical protein FK004_06105 [Flavobacterium kingsejongi]
MNRSDFNQTGGYPLKTERLQEVQTAFEVFNALGNIAGNLVIISGCEITGNSIASGTVFINNEVLEFRTGYFVPDSTVVIFEEPVIKEFENGELKPVHMIRYAAIGTADVSYLWTGFKRLLPTKEIPLDLNARLASLEKLTAVFKTGNAPVLWQRPANEIPPGWVEDMTWRGRFPAGFNPDQTEFNQVGKMAGATTKQLTVAELPPHKHYMFTPEMINPYNEVNATNQVAKNGYDGGSGGNENYVLRGSNQAAAHGNTSATGSNVAFSILNPYRVVIFIKFVG